MTQQTYIYRLPSGDASLIEPLTYSGFFELSAPSFSKKHLFKALAEALTLLHRQNQSVLESQQQPAATVPTVAAVEAHSCPPQYDNYGSPFELITCAHCGLSSFKSFLSENGVHLICLYCNRGEWLGFRNQLSTQSVDKAGE
jgi:hypothetical protein